jgi:CRISPR-associated protein Cmr1
MATKAVRAGVKFVLTVSFPTNWDEAAFPAQWINAAQTMFANSTPRQEVEAALWAWETFGGVGARTRRGFGALRCISTQENGRNVAVRLPQAGQVQVKTWLAERFREYVVGENWPKNVPHLALKTIKPVVHKEYSSALSIWKYLIGRLRDFRQMRFGGRYGPSQWPEANEIRRRFGSEAPGVSAFPRAAFGLPIIFHFKDQNNGDPRDTTLVWRGADGTLHDRFASPLILRPLGCEGGQAVGLAAILAGTGVRDALDTLVLKDAPDNPTVSGILTPEDAASVPPLRGSDKVLGTFVDML